MANTITIRNKSTGETKTIPATQATQYGVNPSTQAPAIKGQTLTPQQLKQETSKPPAQQSDGIMSLLQSLFPANVNAIKKAGDIKIGGNAKTKGNLGESIKQAAANTGQLANIAIPAGVEAASYNPALLGQSFLARLGLGGVSGAMGESVREDATTESTMGSAAAAGALNAILPGLSRLFGKGIGKAAFGEGGSMLPELVREVGPIIGTSSKDVGSKLYGKTQPIRESLDTMLSQSSMNSGDVFTNELVDALTNAEKVGSQNINLAKDELKRIYDFFVKKIELDNPNQPIDLPLTEWQSLLKSERANLPSKTWLQKLTSSPTTEEKVGKAFTGELRGKIKDASVEPSEYDRLNKLLQAATQINNNQPRGIGNMTVNAIRQLLPGLGGGVIGGLPGAVTGAALGQPAVASTLISLLESLPADVIRNLMSRGVGSGVGSNYRESAIDGEILQ